MSRVLLTTLGSLGDLHPLLAIGLKLRERGHEIAFCVSVSCQAKIESLGFRFHPLSPDLTPEDDSAAEIIKEIMDGKRGVERLLRKYLFPQLQATYDDLSRAIAAEGSADLLVSGELVYPAPLVAEKTGIRWASCITTPMSFFSAYDPPALPPFPQVARISRLLGLTVNRAGIRLAKLVTRTWSKPVQRLRAELGLQPGRDPIYEGKHSPQLVLALFSRVIAKPQPDWPPNTVVTGFPFYDGESEDTTIAPELLRFLEMGEPPVVFTLGSSAVLDPGAFYHTSVEAARLLRRRAILLVGRNLPPKSLPAEVAAFAYIRFSDLFGRAAAVVHQGGIGTTGHALLAGCPMLVMPYNYDQPDNAARMVRLGVGRSISRKRYLAERVAQELGVLLAEPRYRLAAKAISLQIQRERGAEAACDALEKLLHQSARPGLPASFS
jgi:rhamnosyltransferase subunit B